MVNTKHTVRVYELGSASTVFQYELDTREQADYFTTDTSATGLTWLSTTMSVKTDITV